MNTKLIFPLLIVATAVLGCSMLRDSATNTASPDTAPANAVANSSAPTETRENAEADINAMADRFLEQKSFRATMIGKGDKDTKTDMEFVAPDRFKIRTGPGLETIVIGKDVYLSMGDKFQKIPGGAGDTLPNLRAAFDAEGRKWFSEVRYVGEETANGKPSHVYEYKNRGAGNAGENDSKVWVAKDDGLPVKIESRYKSGPLRSMTVEYSYDPNIKIDVPKQ